MPHLGTLLKMSQRGSLRLGMFGRPSAPGVGCSGSEGVPNAWGGVLSWPREGWFLQTSLLHVNMYLSSSVPQGPLQISRGQGGGQSEGGSDLGLKFRA